MIEPVLLRPHQVWNGKTGNQWFELAFKYNPIKEPENFSNDCISYAGTSFDGMVFFAILGNDPKLEKKVYYLEIRKLNSDGSMTTVHLELKT